ncbi:MAG: hypothetical protein RCG16_00865 [Rickettsia hoogstraalii]
MSKLKIFLASINANKLIEELKKDPATLNINDEVLPNHLEDLIETLKGDDTVKTLKIESSVWNSASLLSHNGITEKSKIELLKAISKMNLNALGLTGLTLNNSDIDIFVKQSNIAKLMNLSFFR